MKIWNSRKYQITEKYIENLIPTKGFVFFVIVRHLIPASSRYKCLSRR